MYSSYSLSVPRDVPDVKSDVIVFLAAFAVCLLFRLPALGDLPLWYDEIITADSIQMSWGGMARERLSQGHFPTYFALLKALGLAGSSEWALRLPSAILDCAAGGMIAVMARRIGGLATVIPAALLYATLPILIIYGQEARPYSLELFFLSLAMFGQLALLTGSDHPQRHAAIATIGTVGAMVTIPASVVIVALQHIALVACGVLRSPALERRRWLRHIATTWTIGLAALILLIPSVLVQADKPAGLMKWHRGASLSSKVKTLLKDTYGFGVPGDMDFYLPRGFNSPLMWSFFILIALGAIANRQSAVHRYLAGLAIGTFAAFIGISVFTAVTGRYLIGMMPAALLLASSGVAVLVNNPRARWLAVLLIGFGVGTVLQGIDTIGSPRKYDWRPIVTFMRDGGVRNTLVFSDQPHIRKELGHYADGADAIGFGAVLNSREPIDQLWKAAEDLPIAWFVLTAQQVAPPRPTSTAISCTWPFGKMKVVMIARDPASVPAALEGDLADRDICPPSV